ncbi:MAG: ROK family protein [Bauldia sp.]|nr:ROK family protein [Bauldia sp.]
MTSPAQIVAVDLGGTNIRVGLINADGTLADNAREPVRSGSEPEQIVNLIRKMARQGHPERAIVGSPGRIDRRAGKVLRARNLPRTDLDQLSDSYLSERCGLPVELAGDAELAAVGESYFGAGSITGITGYLTFSTGVGAAALVEGVVLSGPIGGFQIGFVRSLGFDRPIADVLASGQRIQALAKALGRPIDYRGTCELADGTGEEAGLAREALTDIFDAAVSIAVILCHACTPDVLVIGGGLARATEGALAREIARRLADWEFSNLSWDVAVREAALGDDAALIGGAAWSRARPGTRHADSRELPA